MKSIGALKLLHEGVSLAAAIEPSSNDNFAWVGVYPLDLSRETTVELLNRYGQFVPRENIVIYRLRIFEVEKSLVETDCSLSEKDLQGTRNLFARGDADLLAMLQNVGISIEDLALPYKSNYPI
jgi:hypothetical protein